MNKIIQFLSIFLVVALLVMFAIAYNQWLDENCDYSKVDWLLVHAKGGMVYCLGD